METIKNIVPSWFDVVAFGVLVAGLIHGRKRGMSEEMFDLVKWLTIVVVSALAYQGVGQLLMKAVTFPRFWAMVAGYVVTAVLINGIFVYFKQKFKDKLGKIDIFGKMEFYLGMFAGMLRYFCIMLAVLAVIHSKPVNEEDVRRSDASQTKSLGGKFFPTQRTLHYDILYKSVIGNFVRRHLPQQLMKPVGGQQ